jgi:hypothetical protein
MNAVTLVLQDGSASARICSEGRKDLCQFRAYGFVEELETPGIQCGNVFVEGVDKDTKRELALEFRARSIEHEASVSIGASRKLRQQTCLADTRLARNFERSRTTLCEGAKRAIQRSELSVPPDEMRGELKRRPSLPLARSNQSTRSQSATAST